MINPELLHQDALTWLFEVLEFQYVYRWDIYLRNFKFPISVSVHDSSWWSQLRHYYKHRSALVKPIAMKLRARASHLSDQGLLPELIWYDPALFLFHDEVLQLLPLDFHSTSFDRAMKIAYELEPARSYWVDKPFRHPFYRLGLHKIYPHKFAVPWRPVCDPRTGPSDLGYLSFVTGGGQSRYTPPSFMSSYQPGIRMQLGIGHFTHLERQLRTDYTDSIIPSEIPVEYPDPTEEQVAEWALPSAVLDETVGNSAVTATEVPHSANDPRSNSVSSVTGESNLNRRSGIMTVELSASPSSTRSGSTRPDPAGEFVEETESGPFQPSSHPIADAEGFSGQRSSATPVAESKSSSTSSVRAVGTGLRAAFVAESKSPVRIAGSQDKSSSDSAASASTAISSGSLSAGSTTQLLVTHAKAQPKQTDFRGGLAKFRFREAKTAPVSSGIRHMGGDSREGDSTSSEPE